MTQSRLARFDIESIDALILNGVHMIYDNSLIKDEQYMGWWVPEYKLIRINPILRLKKHKDLADLTILHEWLHAYEDIITRAKKRVKEDLIDQWAEHYRKETDLAQYIRNNFKLYGF